MAGRSPLNTALAMNAVGRLRGTCDGFQDADLFPGTRKLACTKEPDGCARCKREGVVCHYSAQKPMGRPRKRPHVETVPDEEQVLAPNTDPVPEIDWALLDATAPALNFLDMLGPQFTFEAPQAAPAMPQLIPDISTVPTALPLAQPPGSPKAHWHFPVNDIDFKSTSDTAPLEAMDIDPSLPTDIPDFISRTAANHDPALSMNTPTPPSLHSHSTGSAPTPESSHQALHPHPNSVVSFENRVCGCLPALYLALDSLQHLPQTVGPAMRITRHACKTAHDTVLCPSCSPTDVTNPHMRPPVQAFQNMMMLGALLPTIANAYNRILGMVDEETARADAEGRSIAFSLEEYGGLWGRLAETDGMCGATKKFNGQPLPAMEWRRTVRALLKVDVYGFTLESAPNMGEMPSTGLVQVGLKDIVNHMESRSQKRHEAMDKAVADGVITDPSAYGHVVLAPGEKHTCMRIIEIAKKAIEDLVIA
jgi:hypothetical protein